MDGLNSGRRRALAVGFLGLVLIVLGVKYILSEVTPATQALVYGGEPVILYFSLNERCECMQDILQQADEQLLNWPAIQRAEIPVYRIDIDSFPELANKYAVFRVPALILLDAEGSILHRQDYPHEDSGPLALTEFEEIIQTHPSLSRK